MNGVIEACRVMDHSAMPLSVTYPLSKRGMSRGAKSMPGVRATISDIQFADERHKCPFASLSNAVQMATSSQQNAATLKKVCAHSLCTLRSQRITSQLHQPAHTYVDGEFTWC